MLIDDGGSQPGADIWISVSFLNANARPVTCTGIRRSSLTNGAVKAVQSSIRFTGSMELVDLVSDSDGDFNALNANVSVVCLLQPQTVIQSVSFDSD